MAVAIKKTAAIAIAAGLTFAGSAGITAQDALAQQLNQNAATTADKTPLASEIKPGNVYALDIFKRVNPTEFYPANGEPNTPAPGAPLANVEFAISKLQGDVRDQATFNALAEKANEFNKPGATQTEPALDPGFTARTGKTGADGKLTFDNLPAGAYLVKETQPTASANNVFVPARDFIVFVPMTDANGEKWLDVTTVYPKNSEVRVTKTVKDAETHAEVEGHTRNTKIEYTLTGLVPAAPEGKKLTSVILTDSSKKDELRFDTGFVKSVTKGDGTAIDSQYFTVSTVSEAVPANTVGMVEGANQHFTVTITDPAAAGLKPGDEVKVAVEATLLKAADQKIENSVTERVIFRAPGEGATDEPYDTPHSKVETYIGNISVYKRGENKVALSGAEFSVGPCSDDKKSIANVVATGSTGANGQLTFEGLHVTDFADNVEKTLPDYCVVETKAPAGYALPKDEADRIRVLTLTRQTHNKLTGANENAKFEAVTNDTTIQNGVVIDNVKNSVPLLPSTGGMGILIVVLAGLAIIGGGAYAARRNAA